MDNVARWPFLTVSICLTHRRTVTRGFIHAHARSAIQTTQAFSLIQMTRCSKRSQANCRAKTIPAWLQMTARLCMEGYHFQTRHTLVHGRLLDTTPTRAGVFIKRVPQQWKSISSVSFLVCPQKEQRHRDCGERAASVHQTLCDRQQLWLNMTEGEHVRRAQIYQDRDTNTYDVGPFCVLSAFSSHQTEARQNV